MSPFLWTVRVYWEDTDGGGVVYYANYLKFLERARTEWLRSGGYSQAQLAVEPGVLFSVAEVHIKYLKPARLDELLTVRSTATREGAASLVFKQSIHRHATRGDVLTEATVRVVCVSAVKFRPQRLPASLAKMFTQEAQ